MFFNVLKNFFWNVFLHLCVKRGSAEMLNVKTMVNDRAKQDNVTENDETRQEQNEK